MNRSIFPLLIFAAVLGTGCWRSSDSVDDAAAPPAVDGDTVDGNDAPDVSDGGNPPATNNPDPVTLPTKEPPATSDDDDVRHLRDMASQDPRTLAAATDYFAETYDDNGVQVFYEHLQHADPVVRRGSIYGLFAQFDRDDEKMLSTLQAALDDDDPIVRRVALKVMSLPNYPRTRFLEAIPRIVKHLNDAYEPDVLTRGQVARMLTIHTTRSQAALPALTEAAGNDPEANVRLACLQAISKIAQTADEALLPPKQVLLNDTDPRLRRAAANRLGNYGPKAAPVVDALITALADQGVPQRATDDPLLGTDEPVCIAAANALARVGKPAVKPLLVSLKSENQGVRLLSMRALGDIGPDAAEAVAALQAITKSANPGEATAAKAALVRIGA